MIDVSAEIDMAELKTVIREEMGDRRDLVETFRQELKEMDLSELFSQADIGDSLDQRIEEVSDRLDNMPDVDDMKSDLDELEYKFDDKIPDLERDIERLGEMIEENKEDWKAVRGEPSDKRLEELEHAMLCIFEYLNDSGQRLKLAHLTQLTDGEKRFIKSVEKS